jgi:thymidylate synthase (FAD)
MKNATAIEELRWKKFPIGSDGFVCLVDVMGDDSSITQAARVSYGKDLRDEQGKEQDDRTLIRYLMRHRHSTPFEMAEVKLLVRVPMDCWRQWIRHRTANVNEYSTRYTQAIDSCAKTEPEDWRRQATNNKQGSGGYLSDDWPEGWRFDAETNTVHGPDKYTFSSREDVSTPGKFLSYWETKNQDFLQKDYNIRLELGVAKEQARKDLPLSTYTEAYWKCDLFNILHFLGLRMDSHAQLEIREYANCIGEQIIAPLFPEVWSAFSDYRLNGTFLTGLDKIAIGLLIRYFEGERGTKESVRDLFVNVLCDLPHYLSQYPVPKEWMSEKCRERDEFIQKAFDLHLLVD